MTVRGGDPPRRRRAARTWSASRRSTGTRFDLRAGRRVGELELDDGFADVAIDGRRGRAHRRPRPTAAAVTLWGDESFGFVQVYTSRTFATDDGLGRRARRRADDGAGQRAQHRVAGCAGWRPARAGRPSGASGTRASPPDGDRAAGRDTVGGMRDGAGRAARSRPFWPVRSRAQSGVLAATRATVLVVTFLASTMVGLAVRSPTVAVRQSIEAGPARRRLARPAGVALRRRRRAGRTLVRSTIGRSLRRHGRHGRPVRVCAPSASGRLERPARCSCSPATTAARPCNAHGRLVAGSGRRDRARRRGREVAVDRELAGRPRPGPRHRLHAWTAPTGPLTLAVSGVWRAAHPERPRVARAHRRHGRNRRPGHRAARRPQRPSRRRPRPSGWSPRMPAARPPRSSRRLHSAFTRIADTLTRRRTRRARRSPGSGDAAAHRRRHAAVGRRAERRRPGAAGRAGRLLGDRAHPARPAARAVATARDAAAAGAGRDRRRSAAGRGGRVGRGRARSAPWSGAVAAQAVLLGQVGAPVGWRPGCSRCRSRRSSSCSSPWPPRCSSRVSRRAPRPGRPVP